MLANAGAGNYGVSLLPTEQPVLFSFESVDLFFVLWKSKQKKEFLYQNVIVVQKLEGEGKGGGTV